MGNVGNSESLRSDGNPVPQPGFEPGTSALSTRRSSAELPGLGGAGRTRTDDLQFMRLASYRLLYRASWPLPARS